MSDTPAWAVDQGTVRGGTVASDADEVTGSNPVTAVRPAQSPSFGLDWWPLRWRVPCFCVAVFDVVH